MPATRKKNAKDRPGQAGTIDHELVKAMAHPLRYQILMRFNERVASPTEIAKELGESVGVVSYHVRLLEEMGFVELVDEQPRRGAVEHFFRATQRAWFSKDGWARLPVGVRRSMAGATLEEIAKSVTSAAKINAFDALDVHVSYTPLQVDDQGFADACSVLDEAIQKVLDIQAESVSRAASGDSDTERPTQLVLMHFDRGK
jgi:DNA-binding transcriptional ArsR family regulator